MIATPVGDLALVADGLHRPEGICFSPDGSLWVSDERALVARVDESGRAHPVGEGGVAPNGLAVDHQGRILVADYGEDAGLVRVDPVSGRVDLRVNEVEGRPVRRANHPAVDDAGRIWCTCSTLLDDDLTAVQEGVTDGYVFVVDGTGAAHVVADGLAFANGLAFSPDGRWLYVAESGAERIRRAPVRGSSLGAFEQVGPSLGAVPDGVAVDSAGSVWVTLVFQRNAVVVIDPDGAMRTAVEDEGGLTLRTPTNIAFGGPDRADLYITSADTGRVLRMPTRSSGTRLPPPPS
jgi:gluconolactonase